MVNEKDQCNDSQLKMFTFLFSKRVCTVIEEMTGLHFHTMQSSYHELNLSFDNSMTVYIPFYGCVQGEFLLSTNEQSAFTFAAKSGMFNVNEKQAQVREYSCGLFNEILNIGVGQTITELEKIYDNLTYSPAISIFGSILFPKVRSSLVEIKSEDFLFKCGFSLNLVRPKIADTLQDVQRSLKSTVKLANTDALTGLHNRAFFDLHYHTYVNNALEKSKNLSLIIIDVDHFKHFNDSYGHLIGDRVLSNIAEVVESKIRGGDFAVRYGGDEIVIILNDTDLNGARLVCERISHTVKETKNVYKIDDGEFSLDITLSIGITQLQHDDNPETLFTRADTNLYKAKSGGRDRIVAL